MHRTLLIIGVRLMSSNRKMAQRLPPKPEKPLPEDCCGGGCDPCVFELYEEELERWQARVDAIRARNSDTSRRGGP